jgi:chemotaxis protein CheD
MPISDLYEKAREPNFYYDAHFNIDAVKILPGEYYATVRPMLIVTVLGSCVATCIWDKTNGIGGMNHFMLPSLTEATETNNTSARYGTYAMEVLINQLLDMGAQPENLEAKIFGGSNLPKSVIMPKAGERNAAFVRNYLNKERIPIVAEDLLDAHPRKIYFFPDQGTVMVKKLIRLHNDTIILREQEHDRRMCDEELASGTVDLFSYDIN